jgi:hypothetical protein
MKKFTFLLLVFLMPFMISAQEEDDSYVMWETMYITPDYTKLTAFSEAMGKHNKTYHKAGPYAAMVYNVSTGPNVGKLVWLMGPCTYTHLDSRPSDGGHDEDWANNVMPYIKKMHHGEYWEMNTDISNVSNRTEPYNLVFVRFHEVEPGQSHRVNGLFKKISAAHKSIEGAAPWAFFSNEFRQGNLGRHLASVWYYDSWAELDKSTGFRNAYKTVHGENSWQSFISEINGIISNSWDEIWAYSAEMSGGQE